MLGFLVLFSAPEFGFRVQFAPWAPMEELEPRDLKEFHPDADVLRPFVNLDGNLAGPHSLLIQFSAGPPQSEFTVSMIHESLWSWGLGLLTACGVLCLIWPLVRWKFPEWLARHPTIVWALLGITWWACLRPSVLGLLCLGIAFVLAIRRFPKPQVARSTAA